MSVKTILVCLSDEASAERITKAACLIARKTNAHVVGTHALESVDVHSGIVVDLPLAVTENYNKDQANRAENIRKTFEQLTSAEDFPSEWRLVKSNSALVTENMVEQAHCADLVIMGQADPDHNRTNHVALQEGLIKQSGRPVLIIPSAGNFETIGEHALMGWSATREASRAIHDSIPVISEGGKATILWVSQSKKDTGYLESTAHAVASCLDRHGIDATVARWQNSEIAIADALLNEAFERGADMIVTGAFGHSKFYDFVIGATTSSLLEQMTVPVLFSN